MHELRTHVDEKGKILIPSTLRKKMNLKKGDVLIIDADKKELKIHSLADSIKSAQDLVRKYVKTDNLVDEFLEARRMPKVANKRKNKTTEATSRKK